ncbi:hypothetical protein N9018_01605 [Rhodopirellula sp.]|nr:hypothetical protein [Rhodopirellula sp.]
MRISEVYAGAFFKAGDFLDPRFFVIERVECQAFKDGSKPVLFLRGEARQVVLNKSNSMALRDVLGDDTVAWHGRHIRIYSAPTFFQGQSVKGLRVEVIDHQDAVTPPANSPHGKPQSQIPKPFNPPPIDYSN